MHLGLGTYGLATFGARGEGGAPAFSPSDIAGLQLWYDPSNASSIHATGSSVDQLDDLSGNARHLLASASARPTTGTRTSTRGLNVLDFNGTNNVMQTGAAFTINQPTTMFFVAQDESSAFTDGQCLCSGKTSFSGEQALLLTHSPFPTKYYRMYAGTTVNGTTVVNASQHVHCLIFSGTSSYHYLDGAADITAGNAGTTPLGAGFTLGARASAAGGFWDGEIGEFIMYNSVLSAGDIASVTAYLTEKW